MKLNEIMKRYVRDVHRQALEVLLYSSICFQDFHYVARKLEQLGYEYDCNKDLFYCEKFETKIHIDCDECDRVVDLKIK